MRVHGFERFAPSGQELATKSGGLLMLAGSLLIIVTVALPPAAQGSDRAILAAAVCSALIGLFLTLKRRAASIPVLALSVAVGTAVIGVTTHEAGLGTGAEDNELLYVWVCLYSFNFLPIRVAIAELLGVGISYAWVLSAVDPDLSTAVTRWLVVMATLAVAGLLVSRLRTSRDRAELDLSALAHHDGLTGSLNRGAIEDRAAIELARSRRYQEPVSLLVVDVDGLKEVNDTRGHPAGDRMLRDVATTLSGATRTVDSVARIGGDEFAVLLPGVDAGHAARVAARIARSLDAPGGRRARAKVSIGIAVSPDQGATFDELLGAADEAMYVIKRAGGDGVRRAGRTIERWEHAAH